MSETDGAAKGKKETRVEREVELNAPVEEVWKALTDPEELKRWFPLEARVTPPSGQTAEDGKIFLSWGGDCEGEAKIVAWEPNKRFAWKEETALIEFTLEARALRPSETGSGQGGKTILRLVQTGFMSGESWEDEWNESTSYGWEFMLLGLRWALERHRGVERQVAWPRVKSALSREETYRRLMRAGGLFVEDAGIRLRAGESYAMRSTIGETFSGRVELRRERRGICVSVLELNDALLWLTIEGGPGKIEAQLWLSAFGVEAAKVEAFQRKWRDQLKKIFKK